MGESVGTRHLECLCTKFSTVYFTFYSMRYSDHGTQRDIRWVNLTDFGGDVVENARRLEFAIQLDSLYDVAAFGMLLA